MKIASVGPLRGIAAAVLVMALVGLTLASRTAVADPAVESWKNEWPRTDFGRTSVDLSEIVSGGPPRDGIPSIDEPTVVPVRSLGARAEGFSLENTEPVIGVIMGGEARAYPLSLLLWHEIVNDTLGGTPIAVTFCPLCNAAIVFDRRVGDHVLDFGTTGNLRFSDLVMYDRQTESWWQQFLGEAIVGALTGTRLRIVPARLESWSNFRERTDSTATIVVPADAGLRRYGANPYKGYDSSPAPLLYRGGALSALQQNEQIAPLARVITLDRDGFGQRDAWSLDLLRDRRRIVTPDGFVITWEPGQNSALDARRIARGADVGNVVVQRRTADGDLVDHPYGVDFAFAYKAFFPDRMITTR